MKKVTITIHHSILINKSKEETWDYTQDYAHRTDWDSTILKAEVLQERPRIVSVKFKGGIELTFVYKLYDRPNKTSLALQDIKSRWIIGGGGSWNYQEINGGTLWAQTNTLIFKPGFLNAIFIPLFKLRWKREIQISMLRAKRNLEKVSSE